ncbi:MAG TPA: hypothetical protein VHB25_13215 [Gemmatimonadaceae bacterium]|nr:hypothetical protein [Gemmatimonadaceae bacterium]
MSAIWITWEKQRRNRSMAAAVGATLHEMDYPGARLTRYWMLGRRTVRLIRESRPTTVFFQNPSMALAALVATLKFLKLTHARTIGDFHNAGVYPPAARFLVPWIVRHTDLVIVSNRNLEPAILAAGGRCMSVPDPLPDIEPAAEQSGGAGRFEAFFICSWADDEPIVEVLEAARHLTASGDDVVISISGRPRLERVGWREPVPSNVELTGFLSAEAFDARLAGAAAVIDLTTRDDCMVCGAYEAVSAEVPMIVSGNEPTRLYFRKGAIFTDNTAADIARAVLEVKRRHAALKAEVADLKRELLRTEQETLGRLRELSGVPSR